EEVGDRDADREVQATAAGLDLKSRGNVAAAGREVGKHLQRIPVVVHDVQSAIIVAERDAFGTFKLGFAARNRAEQGAGESERVEALRIEWIVDLDIVLAYVAHEYGVVGQVGFTVEVVARGDRDVHGVIQSSGGLAQQTYDGYRHKDTAI